MMSSAFDDIWRSLNQRTLQPVSPRWSDQSKPSHGDVMRHFAATSAPTIINLHLLSAGDKEFLSSRQISAAYLLDNFKRTINTKYYDPRAFQAFAVKTGAVHAICPFTGKHVTTRHSLLANIGVIFYRFESERVFFVISAGIGGGFQKSALYFPDFELIVTAGDEWGFQREDLIELKARVVGNCELVYRYLSNASPQRARVAVCIGFYHFAHHLWNELSGLQRLRKANILDKVDDFFVLREPLGKLNELFPEIPANKIHRLPNTEGLFNKVLESGCLAIKVGGDFVARELITRVHRVAESTVSSNTLNRIANAKRDQRLLLWIGIRVGNRAWADQAVGLSSLIKSLAAEFPKLSVVFDGFSMPADKLDLMVSDSQARELIDKERDEVDQIVQRIEQDLSFTGIEVFNIIGCSILEAILWARAIDCYVSPYGSLQHKVAWFASKPGIIHSNKTILQNPANYVSRAVEDIILPHYLDSSDITDVPSNTAAEVRYNEIGDSSESGAGILMLNKGRRANPEFNNYTVDLTILRDDLLALIRSRRDLREQVEIFAIGLKRNLRDFLRSVTTAFDLKGI